MSNEEKQVVKEEQKKIFNWSFTWRIGMGSIVGACIAVAGVLITTGRKLESIDNKLTIAMQTTSDLRSHKISEQTIDSNQWVAINLTIEQVKLISKHIKFNPQINFYTK